MQHLKRLYRGLDLDGRVDLAMWCQSHPQAMLGEWCESPPDSRSRSERKGPLEPGTPKGPVRKAA